MTSILKNPSLEEEEEPIQKLLKHLEHQENKAELIEHKRLALIDELIPTDSPLKLTSRLFKSSDTVIEIQGIKIGGKDVVLMAGPCAIESEEQLIATALELKKSGVAILRASAFKPRTSPYSFQGLGLEGLKMHKKAQNIHGLITETEVMDPRMVQVAAEHVDILRVGARNMQNYDLLKALGKVQNPVIIKRGIGATIEEWILAAEYVMAYGNPNVILCERGIRTFEPSTRSTLDLSSVVVAKQLTHLPIIVDPSHAAGRVDLIPSLSKGAIAVGADGLLIEVHHNPKQSKCDARQALSPAEFEMLAKEVTNIAKACHKEVHGRKGCQ